jgi:hypothetical protein
MRNLRLWSAAPVRNVETASTSTVNVLRGLVARATTPLLPDDYLKLLNPLWSARNCVASWSMFAGKPKTRPRSRSNPDGGFPATTGPASTSASECVLVGAGIGGLKTSSPSPPRRSSDAPLRTRVWRCFLAGFAVASPPCRDQIANRIELPTPIICPFGRMRFPARARPESGRCYNSGTVVRPSKPTPGGWCSPVGPMRTYRIGAILLDLDEPKRIRGQLPQTATEPRY